MSIERGPEREPREVSCPQCGGSGTVKDNGSNKKCSRCGGRGTIVTR